MLGEIMAGVNSLKAAKDIVQGLSAIKTEAAVNDAKISLQGHILDAQQSLFAAQEASTASAGRIAELEQEIARLKDWSNEARRYELADAGQGTLAYRPKAGMDNGEPPHWLCAPCFQQGRKSFLQPQTRFPGATGFLCCSTCKAEIVVVGDIVASRR